MLEQTYSASEAMKIGFVDLPFDIRIVILGLVPFSPEAFLTMALVCSLWKDILNTSAYREFVARTQFARLYHLLRLHYPKLDIQDLVDLQRTTLDIQKCHNLVPELSTLDDDIGLPSNHFALVDEVLHIVMAIRVFSDRLRDHNDAKDPYRVGWFMNVVLQSVPTSMKFGLVVLAFWIQETVRKGLFETLEALAAEARSPRRRLPMKDASAIVLDYLFIFETRFSLCNITSDKQTTIQLVFRVISTVLLLDEMEESGVSQTEEPLQEAFRPAVAALLVHHPHKAQYNALAEACQASSTGTSVRLPNYVCDRKAWLKLVYTSQFGKSGAFKPSLTMKHWSEIGLRLHESVRKIESASEDEVDAGLLAGLGVETQHN